MNPTKLKNPPIVEAILQIKFNSNEIQSIEEITNLKDKFEGLTEFEEKFNVGGTVNINKSGIDKENIKGYSKLESYNFFNNERTILINANDKQFSYHINKNYKDWNKFISNIKSRWDTFKTLVKPSKISRIGLRYINKIRLTTPLEIENYFNITKMGGDSKVDGLDYDIFSFYNRVGLINDKIKAKANLTFLIQPIDGQESEIDIILDIDVFKIQDDISLDFWKDYEELREFKNEIFFKLLTDKMIEIIENKD